mmetsp:Transcript_114782/g.324398  ORF Transcript_114782/g.324398 Transcript_114782/m.324398 type:complete len:201 (+) Transcript_114782:512-1114(+)
MSFPITSLSFNTLRGKDVVSCTAQGRELSAHSLFNAKACKAAEGAPSRNLPLSCEPPGKRNANSTAPSLPSSEPAIARVASRSRRNRCLRAAARRSSIACFCSLCWSSLALYRLRRSSCLFFSAASSSRSGAGSKSTGNSNSPWAMIFTAAAGLNSTICTSYTLSPISMGTEVSSVSALKRRKDCRNSVFASWPLFSTAS